MFWDCWWFEVCFVWDVAEVLFVLFLPIAASLHTVANPSPTAIRTTPAINPATFITSILAINTLPLCLALCLLLMPVL